MSGELIYLASPYSHPNLAVREARFQAVCRVAGEMMQAGLFVYSPIAHTHPIAEVCDLPLGCDFWYQYDRVMLSRCQCMVVLMLDGWTESTGIKGELAIAEELGIPVEFKRPPGGWRLVFLG